MGMVFNGEEFTDNTDIITKNLDYSKYIYNHIMNVVKAANNIFIKKAVMLPLESGITLDQSKEAIEKLKTNIINHDLSKWSDEEFPFYRKKFYPTENEKNNLDQNEIELQFQEAWKHHYMNNAHHPMYWKFHEYDSKGVLIELIEPREEATPMSLEFIFEMICDWEAMSMNFGSSTIDWYENKADEEKKSLNTETKKIIDLILPILITKEYEKKE